MTFARAHRWSSRRIAGTVACLLLVGCGGAAPPPAKNLVVITLDTTRADALGCLGGSPAVTPRLDELAAEGLLFETARTPSPMTLPAHAAMFTGLYPPRSAVRDNTLTPVPAEARTLAEAARDAGLSTAAVIAAAPLTRSTGIAQGFEHFDDPYAPDAKPRAFGAREASAVSAACTAWLDELEDGERFFLWAHYFDPHEPLDPTPEHLERAGGDPYLACVARMDDGVGDLLDALRARADWDETLVLVVGDHGEALGEHGEKTHAAFVYDATLRVPLIARFPPGAAPAVGEPGARVDVPTSVVDVFPTAIQALGLTGLGAVDGRSLADAPDPARGVYFESYYGSLYHQWSPLAGWADGALKYIHGSRSELYRVAEDPGELDDVIEGADVGRFRASIERLLARPALSPAEGAGRAGAVDPDVLAELQRLGYASAGGVAEVASPLDVDPALPSPHDRAEELLLLNASLHHGARREHAREIELLERIVAMNPRNHAAWSRLGKARLRARDVEGATEALERFVEIGPPWPVDYLNLGACYRALGRTADAAAWLEKGLALDPENERARADLEALRAELAADGG